MAKEVLDIFVEQGYEYPFVLDYNDALGVDLEADYYCYFNSASIGLKQFSVVNNQFTLTLTQEDTGKVTANLEPYTIYTVKIADGSKDKLLSGRIILDKA